jgi:hypothetical protein
MAGAFSIETGHFNRIPSSCQAQGPAMKNARDRIEEMLYGQSGLAEKRRSEEIEHARELARIRTESHALVWVGTAEELIATLTRWYECGWIIAENLQDALQKAAIHFANPDGMPITRPATAPADQGYENVFSPSPTYQKLMFRGKEYDLTSYKYAPDIIKVLHQSLKSGEPGLTTKQIRERARLPHNGKMYDWFRGTRLWKNLVVIAGPDMYRLDISPLL